MSLPGSTASHEASRRAFLLVACAFAASCGGERVTGPVYGSDAEFRIGHGRYATEFFFDIDAVHRAGEWKTIIQLKPPVVILRSDLEKHIFWGDAVNGVGAQVGKPHVTKTGTIGTESIYYVEKDQPPIAIAPFPQDMRFVIRGARWSPKGLSAILAGRLLADETDPTCQQIRAALLKMQAEGNEKDAEKKRIHESGKAALTRHPSVARMTRFFLRLHG